MFYKLLKNWKSVKETSHVRFSMALSILTSVKIFFKIPAGRVFFDVGKFFAVHAILIAVVNVLYIVFVHKSIRPFKLAGSDIAAQRALDFAEMGRDLAFVSQYKDLIPLTLTFFYVFFTLPPKTLKHVTVVAFLISMITAIQYIWYPVSFNPLYAAALEFVIFFATALVIWLCSIGVYKMQQHIRQKRESLYLEDI